MEEGLGRVHTETSRCGSTEPLGSKPPGGGDPSPLSPPPSMQVIGGSTSRSLLASPTLPPARWLSLERGTQEERTIRHLSSLLASEGGLPARPPDLGVCTRKPPAVTEAPPSNPFAPSLENGSPTLDGSPPRCELRRHVWFSGCHHNDPTNAFLFTHYTTSARPRENFLPSQSLSFLICKVR